MTIMKATNETLFSSKDLTAKLVQNGDYMKHLQALQPLLRSWYQRFNGIEGEVDQSITCLEKTDGAKFQNIQG